MRYNEIKRLFKEQQVLHRRILRRRRASPSCAECRHDFLERITYKFFIFTVAQVETWWEDPFTNAYAYHPIHFVIIAIPTHRSTCTFKIVLGMIWIIEITGQLCCTTWATYCFPHQAIQLSHEASGTQGAQRIHSVQQIHLFTNVSTFHTHAQDCTHTYTHTGWCKWEHVMTLVLDLPGSAGATSYFSM